MSASEQHPKTEEEREHEAWLAADRETSRRIWKWSAVLFVIAVAVFIVLMLILSDYGAQSEAITTVFD